MTKTEIQAEWDSFIEYPHGSDKRYVTTTSALIFARSIAEMVKSREREACAKVCDVRVNAGEVGALLCAIAIRARGQT